MKSKDRVRCYPVSAVRRIALRPSPARPCRVEALEPRQLFAAYSVIDLGALGGTTSKAFDINNAGQVVGSATTQAGATRAFRFSDTNHNGIADPCEMTALDPVARDLSSGAYSI